MRVLLAEQVVHFVRRLPPEPRRRIRRSLRDLARERGDITPLEPPLDGYSRLRVGGYRIILSYARRNTIECIFAERRSVVYEMVAEVLRARLMKWTP
jgi:mRNA-degrading endonuclease RelE of RelBE toxin-antitoxin system